jgi:hypothetical protein
MGLNGYFVIHPAKIIENFAFAQIFRVHRCKVQAKTGFQGRINAKT